jgi:hypothetical protein
LQYSDALNALLTQDLANSEQDIMDIADHVAWELLSRKGFGSWLMTMASPRLLASALKL